MRTYTLYIKTPYMDAFRAFTTGDDDHIDEWIKYVTRKYEHTSYYVKLCENVWKYWQTKIYMI